MTAQQEKQITPSVPMNIYRVFYGLFILLSIYYFVRNDVSSAMSNLGIALIFDPFDQQVKWNDRPRYQRIWLLTHLAVLLVLAAFWVTNIV